MASAIGSAASGAATGAALGSVVPGAGTAIGAAIGGGLGLLKGIGASSSAKRSSKALAKAMGELKVDKGQERSERYASMQRGKKYAQEEILGKEGLGRVSQSKEMKGGMQEVLQRRRQQMEQGIDPAVLERRRSQMLGAQTAG